MTKDVQTQAKQDDVPMVKPKSISEMIYEMRDQIKDALPSTGMTEVRLARIAITAIRQNPTLGSCTFSSLIGALVVSAQLGLEPNTPLGQCYMIPRKKKVGDNKWVMEAQFQMGYQGILDLVYRSGRYSSIIAREVYPNDDFVYDYGIPPNLHHRPSEKQAGEPCYYYAVARLSDGSHDFAVMSREQIVEHAKKFSDSFSSSYSPWVTNFDAMAKKTVIAGLLKYAQKSTDLREAVQIDGAVISARRAGKDNKSLDMDYSYAPDLPPEPKIVGPEVPEVGDEGGDFVQKSEIPIEPTGTPPDSSPKKNPEEGLFF